MEQDLTQLVVCVTKTCFGDAKLDGVFVPADVTMVPSGATDDDS